LRTRVVHFVVPDFQFNGQGIKTNAPIKANTMPLPRRSRIRKVYRLPNHNNDMGDRTFSEGEACYA
jgi:hypothetical protein